MDNIEIIKAQLILLDKLPYETITHFNDKKIYQKTYVKFDVIINEINSLRSELIKLGYNYYDGKLIEIKHN